MGILRVDDDFFITAILENFNLFSGKWIAGILIDGGKRIVADYTVLKQSRAEISIGNGQGVSILRIDLFL